MNPVVNILVIDDDEDDFFITSQYLTEISTFSVVCDWCYNIQEARRRLLSNAYDIYLLDFRLGARTGLDLLKEAVHGGTYKPIILLTGKGNPEIDRQAVEAGAYDYLIKSEINTEKLERCLRYTLERFKNFKRLNDSEKKFRLIFENALSFIFTCSDTLIFEDCNAAAEYFLGYSPAELKNTSLLTYIEDADKQQFIKLVQARKNIRQHRVKFMTKTGVTRQGSLSLSYFEDESFTASWQGIVYDETIRVQAEQNKLQSQKIDATYRLVRTLAHEIRNPLTNIGLSVENLKQDNVENPAEYHAILERSYTRINHILSELIQSSGAVELKPALVDLKELTDNVLAGAADRIKLSGVTVERYYPDFPVVKIIDREKFTMALNNLILNAIEAMDKEERLLSVSINKTLEHTIISVKDNGKGIGPEDHKRLFEPYFTTKKSGMGLGLVSALNIIKSHNAIVEVDSKPGQGSAFKIVFVEEV